MKTLALEKLAEREGFEPPIELPLCRISSAVHSTALPSLREIEKGSLKIPAGRYGAAYGIAPRGLQHPLCADTTESICPSRGHNSVPGDPPAGQTRSCPVKVRSSAGETNGYATQRRYRHGRLAIRRCHSHFPRRRNCHSSGRIHGRDDHHQRGRPRHSPGRTCKPGARMGRQGHLCRPRGWGSTL